MIVIIDYNAGNLRNVQKAFQRVGYTPIISSRIDCIEQADILILPGVGAYADAMTSLRTMGVIDILRTQVLINKKPFLGICLGMQLISKMGTEGGQTEGLGLLPARVERLQIEKLGCRLPHIGWNSVKNVNPDSILFHNIPNDSDFYFVHSYHMICEDSSIIAATSKYGTEFVCAVEWGNIFATQFHPEKSRKAGLMLIENFMKYCESRKASSPKEAKVCAC